MVVAMRTILIALFHFDGIFTESFLALFAGEHHLCMAEERMRFLLGVAFCAVEPLSTARGANSYLSVENVFTVQVRLHKMREIKHKYHMMIL